MTPRSTRSASERDQTDRLETFYVKAQSRVLQAVERHVTGGDYGGCSWATRAEAERIAELLHLRPGRRLLDIGAGSGWPALYLAELSGCDVTLTDLPLSGLVIALKRAHEDGLPGTCWAVVADGASPPFADGAFDAVSHSDVLCCLAEKRGVLDACRRSLDPRGTMVFSVLSLAPRLTGAAYRRAIDCGPEFIESETDYPTLLEQTGWKVLEAIDVSAEFAASCQRMMEAEVMHADELRALLGPALYGERKDNLQRRHAGASEGLLRREIFVASPDPG